MATRMGRHMLEWLMPVLPEVGFDDPHNGMYVDQKILPLVAQVFSSQVGCIEAPGIQRCVLEFA
jgi:hypothetical protein